MGEAIEVVFKSFAVLIIFFGISSPVIVICLVYYLKKRLDHKQVMAAIEKGTPLAELRPPKPAGPLWIKNLTAGIALLIIAVAMACTLWFTYGGFTVDGQRMSRDRSIIFFAVIFFAVGIARLIRGLLLRKAEKPLPPDNSNDSRTG